MSKIFEYHERGAGYPACGQPAGFVVTYLQGAHIIMCDKHARRAKQKGRMVRQIAARPVNSGGDRG